MQTYSCSTLIDITQTGVYRGKDCTERFQQSNFETIVQTISIITQPYISDILTHTLSAETIDSIFGSFYAHSEQKVWTFTFTIEHSDVFLKNNNSVQRLIELFDKVPFIPGLTETATFLCPVFFTEGSLTNIHFKRID